MGLRPGPLSEHQETFDRFLNKAVEAFTNLHPDAFLETKVGSIFSPSTETGFDFRYIKRRLVTVAIINWLSITFASWLGPVYTWVPTISAAPDETRKGVAPEDGVEGTVTVYAENDPPNAKRQAIIDCAERWHVEGATDPRLLSVEYHPVVWSVEQSPGSLIVVDSALVPDDRLIPGPGQTSTPEFTQAYRDTHLAADGSAVLRYHTAVEPPSDGAERVGSFVVKAVVQRPEWEVLLADVSGRRLAQVEPDIAPLIEDLLRVDMTEFYLENAIHHISQVLAQARNPVVIAVPVTYHESDQLTAPDPCSLITHAEAEAASGFAVNPGERRAETFPGNHPGQLCVFIAADTPANAAGAYSAVRLGTVDLGQDAATLFDTLKSQSQATGSVGGLGDDDFYFEPPEGSAILFIRRKNVVLVVTVITADGLAQATEIGRRALTRF